MEDFDPERSAREMRKMNRRIYREKYVIYWLPQRFNLLFILYMKFKGFFNDLSWTLFLMYDFFYIYSKMKF